MSATFKKAHKAQRKAHRERSQPQKRSKLGLLEKGKDWKLRRDDYHFKGKRLKAMYEKARNKNPDEFYSAMVHKVSRNGIHRDTRDSISYTVDEMKLMRTQDLTYVNMRRSQERQKIDKLKAGLHLLIDTPGEDDSEAGPAIGRQHIVFVGSKKKVDTFDPVSHLKTAPELINRAYNRPTADSLKHHRVLGAESSRKLEKMDKQRVARYQELEQRIDRLETLNKLAEEMQTQRNIQGKGQHKKVVDKATGKATYKWRKERKG